MNWLLAWIVIYLVLILILSLRHIRVTDPEQYLVNNRSTKLIPLLATTLATFVGGGTSIGLMALGYESGFAAVGIGVAYVIGFFIMVKFAGKIRDFGAKNKIYSFPHYLNYIYTAEKYPGISKVFSSTVSGVNIFIFFFMLAAQFVAMASLLKFSFEIGYLPAAIISTLIVIFYTAVAGMSGVIITDLIQFIAILIMIVLIFIPGICEDTVYLSRLKELPSNMLNGTYYGYVFIIGLLVFLSWSVLVRLDIWQRILAAKDKRTARKTMLLTGLGMLPFYIIFPLVGMAVRLTFTGVESPKDVAFHFINAHSSGFVFGFAIIGMLSALMSTGDSFLNIISISAVKDFRIKNKSVNLEKQSKKIRIVTVLFGTLALAIALIFPHIVDLLVVGLSTITLFVPVTLFALINKNAGKYSDVALCSILTGFIVNLAFFIYGVLFPENFEAKSSFVPGFFVSTLIMITGVLWKKSKINVGE